MSPGTLTRDPLVKGRQPLSGLSTVQGDELIHETYRAGTSRDHRQLGIEALEIQLAHQTLMSLFHEETARAGFEFNLHEPEFPLAESEAAETQTWLELARRSGYLKPSAEEELSQAYERICSQLVVMLDHADDWVIRGLPASPRPRVPASTK